MKARLVGVRIVLAKGFEFALRLVIWCLPLLALAYLYRWHMLTWSSALWVALVSAAVVLFDMISDRENWHRYFRFALLFAVAAAMLEASLWLVPDLMDALETVLRKPGEYHPLSLRELLLLCFIFGALVFEGGYWMERWSWLDRALSWLFIPLGGACVGGIFALLTFWFAIGIIVLFSEPGVLLSLSFADLAAAFKRAAGKLEFFPSAMPIYFGAWAVGGAVFALFDAKPWKRERGGAVTPDAGWLATGCTADGFPVVGWREDVPTHENIGQALDRMELKLAGGIVVACALFGLFVGGWGGALAGLLIGLMFAPAASRRSVAPTPQNVGGYVPMPGSWGRREPTAAEQRHEAGTMTELWETQALVELRSGEPFVERRGGEVFVGPPEEPFFVVRTRRAGSAGPVSVRIGVPWGAIRDFRLESEQETYQSRTQMANIADYSVINVYARGLGVGVVGHFPIKADGVRIMEQLIEHFSPDAFRAYERKKAAEQTLPPSLNEGLQAKSGDGSTLPDKLPN